MNPPWLYRMYFSSFVIQDRIARVHDEGLPSGKDYKSAIHHAFMRGRGMRIDGDEIVSGWEHTNISRGGEYGIPKDWRHKIERMTAFADRDLSRIVVDGDEKRLLLDEMRFALRVDGHDAGPSVSLREMLAGHVLPTPVEIIGVPPYSSYWVEAFHRGGDCASAPAVDVVGAARPIVERVQARVMADIDAIAWPAPTDEWDQREWAIERARYTEKHWLSDFLPKHVVRDDKTTIWVCLEGPGVEVIV